MNKYKYNIKELTDIFNANECPSFNPPHLIWETIKKLFYAIVFPHHDNHQKALIKYSHALIESMTDIDRFSILAPYFLTKTMNLRAASVLVLDQETQAYEIKGAEKEAENLTHLTINNNSFLIQELISGKKEIVLDTLEQKLKDKRTDKKERQKIIKIALEMKRLKSMVIIPCIAESKYYKKPILLATFNLGNKSSDDAFSREEITFLKTLANQAAIAMENTILHKEIEKAQAQLLFADKLSSLGRIAAGMVHEIKNPLAAVKGMTQALNLNPKDEETLRDFKEVVPKEVDRLNNLVNNLVNLGKPPKCKTTQVDINLLIENSLKLFKRRCQSRRINITKKLDPLPEIEADPEQLTQVFTNLILNAIQAMPEGGELLFSAQVQEDKVIIDITDSGRGIPEDKINIIFEPYFSSKEEGMGLGLSITYRIIKDHNGEIEVESTVGEGTRFRIIL